MECTVVVLYHGALTYYTVSETENGTYEAGLLKYNGDQKQEPPHKVSFKKQGRHCSGDFNDQDLLDDIYLAIKTQQQKRRDKS
ncbi:hypothetical protein OCK74_27045 [Chitinophagaceae bacterium LB-8]|uniref:Uncharacterized protein n=1 Tax=Paraflavisolibacter caeni TaxID=2982496 RepID=A0A9X2Y153_9BACT|nr:hypothetical protein [Paraflavisolibacter caeni]MCU7552805.1 hypothetical protein [Paraflavisolibacter caeni]